MPPTTTFLKDRLLHIRNLPRWIIFALDIVCSVVALWVAFLLRFNFDLTAIGHHPFYELLSIVLILNIAFFYIFKTYSGIVRQTSMEDAWKVSIATFLCVAVLFGWNGIAMSLSLDLVFPTSILLIYLFATIGLLIGYRMVIKVMFEYLSQSGFQHRNVVILGASDAGLITLEALQKSQNGKHSQAKRLNVVAFLDKNSSLWKKQLQGIVILPLNKNELIKLYRKRRIHELIFSEEIGNSKESEEMLTWCLEHKIKVKHIPPVSSWLQDGLRIRWIRDIRIEDLLNRGEINLNNEKVRGAIKDKVLLITGAAGSIGSELVRQVGKYNPRKIILCDQAESPLHELWLETQKQLPAIEIICYLADIKSEEQVSKLFSKHRPDWVLHAAAYKHVPMMERCPEFAILNNVKSTIQLAKLSVKYQAEKFVMVSTDKAVNPTNIMGASKRLAEIFIQSYQTFLQKQANGNGQKHTDFITTRFGNVLGSNGSVVPLFSRQINEGGPVTVTHPDVVRFFMTIPEACQLVMEAAIMGNGGEIFVFDMGTAVKISDLARKMIQLAGLTPDTDIKIKYTGLRPGEKLFEELLANEENTTPTYHPKILIAKVREYPFDQVKNRLFNMVALAEKGNSWEVVRLMKQVVPEFKSRNSNYEKLDREAETAEKEEYDDIFEKKENI